MSGSDLEALATAAEWPAFFTAVRDSARELQGDLSAVNLAYRLAGQRDPAAEVGQGFRTVDVAILRNATLEPWLPHAFTALVARGLVSRFWLGDFGVYESYLVDPESDLKRFGPDVTLLYLDPEELAGDAALAGGPELREAMSARLAELTELVVSRADGAVVVANLAAHPEWAPRVHAAQRSASWLNVRRALNLDLVRRLEEDPSAHLLDVDAAAARFGAECARDPRNYYVSRVPFSVEFMPVLASAFAAVVAPIFRPARKCVVVDCDNTLWGGILGEDGPDGLALGGGYPGNLYRRFQLYLKALTGQGILLAINSKNNEQEVLDFMAASPDMVLREEDFAARRINWADKASNLEELAGELNIGLDAIVHIDDSEVECALIRSLLPEVQVELFPSSPVDIPKFLDGLEGLEVLQVTAEDRTRAETLRTDVQRERLRRSATGLDDFIRSLEIELTIRCQPSDQVSRVSQLTQRTNQFNLTSRRYTPDDIRARMSGSLVYTLSMRDRFSEYGTVGVAIIDRRDVEAEFDTLLLSCRAFGREVEVAFVRTILRDLATRGFKAVVGRYIPTKKNGMVEDFFGRCGFVPAEADGPGDRHRLELDEPETYAPDPRYSIETEGMA